MPKTLALAIVLLLATASSALAYHPDRRELGRIQGLAHELERATYVAHHRAERQRHHFDHAEKHALRYLRRLADESRQFHRRTESYGQDPRRAEKDFADVVNAYVEVSYRLDELHAAFPIERDLQRIGYLVVELDRYYGYLDRHRRGRNRGHHGHRDRDRGRFDRYDDRWDRDRDRDRRGKGHSKGGGRGPDKHDDDRRDRDRDYDRHRDRDYDRDHHRDEAWRTRPN